MTILSELLTACFLVSAITDLAKPSDSWSDCSILELNQEATLEDINCRATKKSRNVGSSDKAINDKHYHSEMDLFLPCPNNKNSLLYQSSLINPLLHFLTTLILTIHLTML